LKQLRSQREPSNTSINRGVNESRSIIYRYPSPTFNHTRKILNDTFPIGSLATFDYDLKIIDDFGDAEPPRNYQYSGNAFPSREALAGMISHRLLVMCDEDAAFARRQSQ
jgi:hypothetical protein